MSKKEMALFRQIMVIKYLCSTKGNLLDVHDIHFAWWALGENRQDFDNGLIDHYRCKSDYNKCFFRCWTNKSATELYREVTA